MCTMSLRDIFKYYDFLFSSIFLSGVRKSIRLVHFWKAKLKRPFTFKVINSLRFQVRSSLHFFSFCPRCFVISFLFFIILISQQFLREIISVVKVIFEEALSFTTYANSRPLFYQLIWIGIRWVFQNLAFQMALEKKIRFRINKVILIN